ncbi:MAG: DUF1800 domain-containing protein [Bacteroidia bacterium]
MSKNTFSRRALFENFLKKDTSSNDPLFEKYAHKKTSARNIRSGLAAYTGAWTVWETLHLLRRTGYGFTKTEVDALHSMGMSAAVDNILKINNTPPSPPVNYYNNTLADENNLPYGADWTTDAFSTGAVGRASNKYRWQGLQHWNLGLALNKENNIREKMVWFWYHFIPVDFENIFLSSNKFCNTNSARICYQYIKLLRDNALGNFKTIIRAVATQPAMMFYLNNNSNTKTAPDENFAREVMELFTLGKDPLSQYTQTDVEQAAKLLTGWRVQDLNTANTTTQFNANLHDTSDKQFSSFFNNKTISNLGTKELDAFFDMIFSKSKVVSEYICRRLYRYFVYYDIDATTEANVIQPLAATFVKSNWDIVPVLNQLFKSEHFFDMQNRGSYIKSPFDLVIGSLRAFNLNYNVSDATNYEAQYKVWGYFNTNMLTPMQQLMGDVPNVSGWQAFYQKPSFHEYWINSNTTQNRFVFLQNIFNGYNINVKSLATRIEVDVIAFVQPFGNVICEDPDLLVNECIQYLLPIDISAILKNDLKLETLLYQQTTNAYWTSAWNNYITDPTNNSNKMIVKNGLKRLLTTITQYAEYQLM